MKRKVLNKFVGHSIRMDLNRWEYSAGTVEYFISILTHDGDNLIFVKARDLDHARSLFFVLKDATSYGGSIY